MVAVSYDFISWVPSGLILSSGCSLMALLWQVFPFCLLKVQAAHAWGLQLLMIVTSVAYLYGRQYSIYQLPLLVGSLTDVCETFHDQFVFLFFFSSHIAGRLFSCQGNILVEFQDYCAISRLYPVDNKRFSGRFVLLVYYDPENIFRCCLFPFLELP